MTELRGFLVVIGYLSAKHDTFVVFPDKEASIIEKYIRPRILFGVIAINVHRVPPVHHHNFRERLSRFWEQVA